MDRTIVITGGSGAIGGLLIDEFLRLGDSVFVVASREQSLVDLKSRIGHGHERLTGEAHDLGEPESITALAAAIPDQDRHEVILVNNARSRETLRAGPDGTVARADFVREYLIDVIVPYELTMATSKRFKSRLTSVVNVGSQYGVVAHNPLLYEDDEQTGFVHYSVAKAALHHLTRELAVRLSAYGTRVNAVAYGGLEGRVNTSFVARYSRLVPSGRMLNATDIPGPVIFLASKAASGVNGHILSVDGGWTVW